MVETLNRQLKNICVLFEFRSEKYKEFAQVTIEFSRVIVKRKLNLVYGGGDQGLSKFILEVVFV